MSPTYVLRPKVIQYRGCIHSARHNDVTMLCSNGYAGRDFSHASNKQYSNADVMVYSDIPLIRIEDLIRYIKRISPAPNGVGAGD